MHRLARPPGAANRALGPAASPGGAPQANAAYEHGGSSLSPSFSAIDGAILLAYLVGTTLVGVWSIGKQATIRDFFLGGRTLPWWAVSGSIIATEISAVTLISVPAMVFVPGGDLRYLQLALGAVLARLIIAMYFVPAFYEREIYSPYDYMAQRLGAPVRHVTSGLFILGSLLGQSARLLIPALLLDELFLIPTEISIWLVGGVSIVWTLLGGITTVIWTDIVQFVVFLTAMVVALLFIFSHTAGGWSEVAALAVAHGKLRTLDFSIDPAVALTLWTGLIANTLLCLNAYGTDQMIAQRMFCCRGTRAARLAIITSAAGLGVMVLGMIVGLGLFAFYQQRPLDAETAARVLGDKDRIFPIFILREMPIGLKGLIIAAIFAAASTTSALAALAQTTVTLLKHISAAARRPPAPHADAPPITPSQARHAPAPTDRFYAETQIEYGHGDLRLARGFIVFWGIALCVFAQHINAARQHYGEILQLALALATFTGGTLLAAFLLALWRAPIDWRGIAWAAPVSVLTVLIVSTQATWACRLVLFSVLTIAACWLFSHLPLHSWRLTACPTPKLLRQLLQTLLLAAALALLAWLASRGGAAPALKIAWPWNMPIGFLTALILGYGLARPQTESRLLAEPPQSESD